MNKQPTNQPTNPPNQVSKLYITCFLIWFFPITEGEEPFKKVGAFFKAQIVTPKGGNPTSKKNNNKFEVQNQKQTQKIRIHVFDLKSIVQTKKKYEKYWL